MTDEHKQLLIKILQDVFTEEELKTICENNTNTLQGNPYHEISGDTINARYSSLVNHLIRKGLINKFLEILGRENQNFASQIESLINQPNISDIQNADHIVSYLFFIIEPKSPKGFSIKAEFAQFKNNKEQLKRFYIELSGEEESKIDSEKEIPNYIDQVIKKMYSKIKPPGLPIIELFLPVNILSKDFDIQQITNDWDNKTPIGKLYPLTVRSYERNFKQGRLQTVWHEKWQAFQAIQNTQGLKSKVHQIESPFPPFQKREKFFQEILSDGFPLCLWTRYTSINENVSVSEKFLCILNIDSDSPYNFCKVYRIHRNIHDIRKKYMSEKPKKTDFGCNLGVLFDHDKIPTGANQLISPNMARNIK